MEKTRRLVEKKYKFCTIIDKDLEYEYRCTIVESLF